MTVHVGFTGTQAGMTKEQDMAVYGLLLQRVPATDLHHGDCIGADDQADQIGRELGLSIVIYPPTDSSKRAWCHRRGGWEAFPPKPYLERNRDIVDACSALIAAPKEMAETLRSGTWATVRHARKVGKPVWIVWPDGSISAPTSP